jgi:predicted nucleic acid-binding protein
VIVIDASALLEFLLQTRLGTRVETRLFRDADEFHAPHLIDVEVVQCLRRLVRMGEVSSDRAEGAIADLADFDLHRHAHIDLMARTWMLRDNVSAYDAVYVALAEALEASFVTCDGPLGKTSGHAARIEVIRLERRRLVAPN